MQRTDRSDSNYYLSIGLAASILLHIGLAILLNPNQSPRLNPAPIMVEFLPALPKQELKSAEPSRQIVSPPADTQQEDRNLELPKFLSDKDSSTSTEQIKRGDGLDHAPVLGKLNQAPPQPKNIPAQKGAAPKNEASKSRAEPLPKLKSLTLDSNTLIRDFSEKDSKSAQPKKLSLDQLVQGSNSGPSNPTVTKPFSRAYGSGAAFLGASGSTDYLPNLPDGDITLLNAKASRFAVFVRRVATQVFSQLRSQGWDFLSARDINDISEMSIVRATLSPKGDLISVQLEKQSGSPNFDQVLVKASKAGARDPNPPLEALASDGYFHFVFESRSWSGIGGTRSGAPIERRWLLLATGLE